MAAQFATAGNKLVSMCRAYYHAESRAICKNGVILTISTFLFLCLGLLAGAVLGAVSYKLYLTQQANAKMRLPAKWPLTSRVLVTNEEHEVFKWLARVFHDHLVMVKLPVLRFTAPVNKDENGGGARWQELLGGVYCTLTVCTSNGNVVGCVDVPGKRGLNKNNRQFKETLLSDCRIAYTVVRSASLPEAGSMRAAFLGEVQIEDRKEAQVTRGGDSSFHAELDSFTKEKRNAAKAAALLVLNNNDSGKNGPTFQPSGFNPDGTSALDPGKSGKFRNQWEDSFIQSDESRPAKLN